MSDPKQDKASLKALLKELRSKQPEVYARAQESNKTTRKVRGKIQKALADEPKTVPSLASELDIPSEQVLWHVMAMRKYGLVAEGEQVDDYFLYRLVPKKKKGR